MTKAGLVLTSILAMSICVPAFGAPKKKKKPTPVWKDRNDPTIPACFKIQGEYEGTLDGGGKLGCQLISLDKGFYQAVLYPGGLPGAGWDGKNKVLLDGKTEGSKVVLAAAKGNKKYLGGPPAEFSATKQFPPPGHVNCTAEISGTTIKGKLEDGKAFTLERTHRESSTMGMKPPKGAEVLFDGTNADAFNGGRCDEKTKLLNTDGRDIRTKKKLNNYVMHVEFMLPYRPAARGQGRGNSGFYQVDMYEVQILDSFGLDGYDNECGGVYKKARPKVNMCLPPLSWQTYDVEFSNAVVKDGKKVKNAFMTLKHNGVIIYDNLEIDSKTGGARKEPEGTPGPARFQGHGNPLQYRNIWIIEK